MIRRWFRLGPGLYERVADLERRIAEVEHKRPTIHVYPMRGQR